jgi:hypothetical protein
MILKTADNVEMERVLAALRELLSENSRRDWAQAMHDLLCEWQEAETREGKSTIARKILTLYGGMGSFNDLGLFKNGQVLREESRQLSELQSDLHRLAVHFV